MLRLDPPAHSADDLCEWISPLDPELDHLRVEEERKKLGPDANHPVLWPYYTGATRYSLTASVTMPEALRVGDRAMATVMDYVLPGKRATRFEVRAVDSRDWVICSNDDAAEFEFARRGLVRVRDVAGADGQPTVVEPPRDGERFVDAAWLRKLDGDLVRRLGAAVRVLSRNEVAVAEGKP